jgi:uncharacterized protein YeaO (DUF488 family)
VPVQVKRVYESPSPEDGHRVLVDRLWPRGLSREDAGLDEWAKDLAPSTELRRSFDHDPDRFEQFSAAYEAELEDARPLLDRMLELANHGRLTLLTATRDPALSQAAVIAAVLERRGA